MNDSMKTEMKSKVTYVLYETSTLMPIKYYTYRKAAHNRLYEMGAGYSVTDVATFNDIRKNGPTKMVKSLMTGEMVEIARDTPWCCNPASETYWSM